MNKLLSLVDRALPLTALGSTVQLFICKTAVLAAFSVTDPLADICLPGVLASDWMAFLP